MLGDNFLTYLGIRNSKKSNIVFCTAPENIENKLKHISKNNFVTPNNLLNSEQSFTLQVLKIYYNDLKTTQYLNSSNITRNKSIKVPINQTRILEEFSRIRSSSYATRRNTPP